MARNMILIKNLCPILERIYNSFRYVRVEFHNILEMNLRQFSDCNFFPLRKLRHHLGEIF